MRTIFIYKWVYFSGFIIAEKYWLQYVLHQQPFQFYQVVHNPHFLGDLMTKNNLLSILFYGILDIYIYKLEVT